MTYSLTIYWYLRHHILEWLREGDVEDAAETNVLPRIMIIDNSYMILAQKKLLYASLLRKSAVGVVLEDSRTPFCHPIIQI